MELNTAVVKRALFDSKKLGGESKVRFAKIGKALCLTTFRRGVGIFSRVIIPEFKEEFDAILPGLEVYQFLSSMLRLGVKTFSIEVQDSSEKRMVIISAGRSRATFEHTVEAFPTLANLAGQKPIYSGEDRLIEATQKLRFIRPTELNRATMSMILTDNSLLTFNIGVVAEYSGIFPDRKEEGPFKIPNIDKASIGLMSLIEVPYRLYDLDNCIALRGKTTAIDLQKMERKIEPPLETVLRGKLAAQDEETAIVVNIVELVEAFKRLKAVGKNDLEICTMLVRGNEGFLCRQTKGGALTETIQASVTDGLTFQCTFQFPVLLNALRDIKNKEAVVKLRTTKESSMRLRIGNLNVILGTSDEHYLPASLKGLGGGDA